MVNVLSVIEEFAQECNHNERLRKMNRDWSRLVELDATDTGATYWLRSDQGFITAGTGAVEGVDLKISAAESILRDVFSGVITPTEPYNAGDLLVKGRQDDLMRLDIITLLIWGE